MLIELEPGYSPSEKEEYMCPKQLEYFRRKLVAWKAELLDEARETMVHLKEENLNEPDINDRATVESDTAFELRTRDRYRKLIDKIEYALSKIESNDYGYCEETLNRIARTRENVQVHIILQATNQHQSARTQTEYCTLL